MPPPYSPVQRQQNSAQNGVQSLFQNTPKKRKMTGLDLQALRQQMPSTFDRTQNPLGTAGALEDMQQNYNELLPPSQQLSTPVGRARNSPDRIAERELRAYSRRLDQQLSPFAQADMQTRGMPQPQQMSYNSVFGAMRPPPILGPTFTIYR